MANLIRMDFYRMRKTKACIVCFILVFVLALATAPISKLLFVFAHSFVPETSEVFQAEVTVSKLISDPFPLFGMMLILISLCYFYFADVENGYIKNIAGQMPMKGFTILSKFMVTFAHNLLFILACIVGQTVGALFVMKVVPDSEVLDAIRVLALKLLLLQSICAILLLVVATFRSKSLGITLAVLFGLGLTSLLYLGINEALRSIFGKAIDISKYMPDAVMGENPLDTVKALLVSLVTGGVFLTLSIRIFDRKDVK